MVEVEVVVEPVIGRRPDVQLRLREQAEHGGTQHVGGGVANLLEGSHLRAGGHDGKVSFTARDSRGGGQGRRQAPALPRSGYSLTISKRIVTTTRMVFSIE